MPSRRSIKRWIVGAYIVEYEQGGTDRAKYGVRLLERLAQDLSVRQMKGLDQRGLSDCRLFYRLYPQIRGSVTPEFATGKASLISAILSRKSSDSKPTEQDLKCLLQN